MPAPGGCSCHAGPGGAVEEFDELVGALASVEAGGTGAYACCRARRARPPPSPARCRAGRLRCAGRRRTGQRTGSATRRAAHPRRGRPTAPRPSRVTLVGVGAPMPGCAAANELRAHGIACDLASLTSADTTLRPTGSARARRRRRRDPRQDCSPSTAPRRSFGVGRRPSPHARLPGGDPRHTDRLPRSRRPRPVSRRRRPLPALRHRHGHVRRRRRRPSPGPPHHDRHHHAEALDASKPRSCLPASTVRPIPLIVSSDSPTVCSPRDRQPGEKG
jgi:hypothetical protein